MSLLWSVLLALVTQQPVPNGVLKRGTVSFDGRATLGDFVGKTDSVWGVMAGGPDLAAVRGWVEASTSLKTGNGRRDNDLRKSMEADRYPTMRFDLTGVTSGGPPADSTMVQLHGVLTIHGVKREVMLPATVVRHGNTFRVRSDFPLNLKDYEIGGLSKMLGILKMNEHTVVHVDVEFASSP